MAAVKNNKLVFIIPIIVAIVSMTVFLLAVANGWMGPGGKVASEFCEASRPGMIKQPANTWSNIAFIVAGILIGWQLMRGAYSENSNSLTRNHFYAIFYASLVVLLGPGSMAMHATTSELGGFFDMLSMYLIASFTVAYAMERFFKLSPIYFVGIFSVILAICIWADGATDIHIIFWFFGDTAFASFIGGTIIIEIGNRYIRHMHHEIKWALASFGLLMFAFLIWNLTRTGTSPCQPDSLIQGHAAWHILCAGSTYCLYKYYASEHKEID
ncbi:MAG: hypothetical protein JWO03_3975 [Bacteroidetes bacterium]|nr:hypothetical protein [Bacteroidota bacterium]